MEQKRLEKIRDKVTKSLEGAPEGHLRLSKDRGSTQYYYCSKETQRNGDYIPKGSMELVSGLAQKKYDKKVLSYTEKCIARMTKLLDVFRDNKVEEIYYGEHPERQKLIIPVEPVLEQRLGEWLSNPYTGKGFSEGAPVILTNSGIRVRSKSEKIIADYCETVGIVYKYECPIVLKPYGTIYPDFTFLSPKTGQEVYWEHEGMMDNPEYARTAISKILLYEKHGIFPGERLILTFETSSTVLDTDLMKEIVERYLL